LVSTTGITGFTLGGGIGWLQRKYGLACDNLTSVDIITADGSFRTASERENEDLFWAVRGGGGNFGVVTSFEYELHPVGPMVVGGVVLHPIERLGDLLRFYREFVPEQPDEFNSLFVVLTAPPAPFIPAELQGTPMAGIVVCWCGEAEEGQRVMAPLKSFGPPAVDLVGPIPYLALQQMFDEAAPPGLLNYWKSAYLGELSDGAIETIVTHAAGITSPLSLVHLHQMGGAGSRKTGTAFSHRDAAFTFNVIGTWTEPEATERTIQWVRSFWDAMQPYASGVYVNFLGNEGQDLVRAAYDPSTYQRLAEIKREYDPDNLFRLNQNIQPGR
jgi:FAD/FMN-containing dehydrogenase